MSKDLNSIGPVAHVAEVVHHGEKLLLPEGMDIDAAINLLADRRDYLEKVVVIRQEFDYFPWDGAYALRKVIERRYGWVKQGDTPGFFSSNPPSLVSIDIDYNMKETVPWGRVLLPSVDGFIETDAQIKNGRVIFTVSAKVKRKDEQTIRSIFQDVRYELMINSIYKGKVIKLRFNDENGNPQPLPMPEFIDPYDVDVDQLIFSEQVDKAVETNLFTPITRYRDCIDNGISIKRGVLLGGTFGTGKTLAAKMAARLAAEAGITFLYVPRADELSQAIEFAKQYQSPACVVFCEDIDRVMDGERNTEMDDILNIIDGIDTKTSNIIVVLTTNELEKINPAMLRPGRLDAVIEVTPPDAGAVEKLLRYYGGDLIAADTSLTRAGVKLEGTIPAVVAEVIKRAKIAQLKYIAVGAKIECLSEEAILESAETMSYQLDLLNCKINTVEADDSPLELLFNSLAKRLENVVANTIDERI
jgi:transitional endoplasmic reticulum ATPase